MEKEEKIIEGQAGFRPNRGSVDHAYTLGKIIHGRKDAGLTPYCFFPDVQKAYDTEYGEMGCGIKLWEYCDQRKDVENDEKIDRMCDKCCDAGGGNVKLLLMFYKELHRDVRYHPIY